MAYNRSPYNTQQDKRRAKVEVGIGTGVGTALGGLKGGVYGSAIGLSTAAAHNLISSRRSSHKGINTK